MLPRTLNTVAIKIDSRLHDTNRPSVSPYAKVLTYVQTASLRPSWIVVGVRLA